MEQYSHYEYGELLANKLKPISHTPEHPHFFTAFGFEDLFGFEDKLSNVTGMVLIAVDGMESESSDNNGDGLTDRNAIFIHRRTQHKFVTFRKQSIKPH